VSGNNKLGGQDFNQRLMLYLYDQLHQTYGSLPTRKEEIHRLRQAVEAVKLNLTVNETAMLRVLLTMPERKLTKELPESEVKTNTLLKGKPSETVKYLQNLADTSEVENNSGSVVFETEISRKLFEMLNEDLFEKILVPIEQVLKE
ncbi:Heat shock 70 kDa protein 13, partial [Calypte anna]